MICNLDKTFCSKRNCPYEECERFIDKQIAEYAKKNNIPLSISDFEGNEDYCERLKFKRKGNKKC